MGKRFINTELFQDSWFMELSLEEKLFYIYLFTNCDHAGIIDLNLKLAEFLTDIKDLNNSFQRVKEHFGKERLIHIQGNYYFLPKFLKFQYPKGLSEKVKAQKSVIDRLKNFNLYDIKNQTVSKQFANSLLTDQDKDIYKDKDKDIKGGGVGEDIILSPIINDIMEYFGFTEIRNPDKNRQTYQFLRILVHIGKLSDFEEQFASYKIFKDNSKEIKHSFNGFLGTIEENYLDGGWNARNWSKEIKSNNGRANDKLMKTPKEFSYD